MRHPTGATSKGQRKAALDSKKIVEFCKFAKAQTPTNEWVWIDTCCIDKKSSAELSEAINSMYGWYKHASVCFAYLEDLPTKLKGDTKARRNAFKRSKWFQRGWTLQELVAPSKVIFCDRAWPVYGSKAQLAKDIERITGIASPFLDGTHRPQDASVAMRMSWASTRQTTKPEDIAYCLLGLFNVNMPLLYGEKLQLEIIKNSDDESIFAWTSEHRSWGMIAPSPGAFKHAQKIVNIVLKPEERMPYFTTNKGLQIRSASDTNAKHNIDPSTGEPMGYNSHVVELGCFIGQMEGTTSEDSDAEEMWEKGTLTVELRRYGQTWQRINCRELGVVDNSFRSWGRNGSYLGRSVQRVYIVNQPDL